jgi:N-acetylglucosaminyl-diphospho-decaprenol L-rhamnosyltransferase
MRAMSATPPADNTHNKPSFMRILDLPSHAVTSQLPVAAGAGIGPGSLTISIVSHGQGALVDTLLRQLARQTAPGLVRRVVITLNLPEQVPPDWTALGAFPVDIVRNLRPASFATNHNRALADCHDGLVAVLNPDIELHDDPFARLAQAASQPGVGLVAPRVLEPDGRVADAARDLLTPGSVLARTLLRRRQASATPAWYAGMCLMLPARAWQAMRGFDESFRMYCEDFDLCARLRLAGYLLVQAPEAEVVHAARRSSNRNLRPLVWHVASLLRVWTSPVYRDYARQLRAQATALAAPRADPDAPGIALPRPREG